MKRPLHVMVAILRDRDGRVLINRRPPGKVQAGRWEFPGGKLESGEASEACLRRELHEELGIVAGPMRPLIRVKHDYPDFSVLLDVLEVEHFGGEPQGREHQELKWVRPDDLPAEDILEADRPIIQAIRLPDRCLVTPDPAAVPRQDFLEQLHATLESGVRLVQFRAHGLAEDDYARLAGQAHRVCRSQGAQLLLNADPRLLREVPCDGIHLTSRRLKRLRERPVPGDAWLSASCHSAADLARAAVIGVDFILAGSVAATPTHPGEPALGWAGFRQLASIAAMPAYAIGGMTVEHIDVARQAGGQGIAAIRGLWKGDLPG